MSLFHLILLALIQGLTEFLPISSSAHLILLPSLTGLQDQGRLLDVAVHIGTLGAVILYFREDAGRAFVGLFHLAAGRHRTPQARLALLLSVATVPVVLFGLFLELSGIADSLRSVAVIGWAMLIFGLVLYWTDRKEASGKSHTDWTLREAVILGLWQALALIPGTSRSGAAISGARAMGYSREDSARIAMLMSIPAILASGTYLALGVVADADYAAAKDAAIAAGLAFVAALLALSLMMRLLKTVSFTPYVIYRVILGVGLLWIAYG